MKIGDMRKYTDMNMCSGTTKCSDCHYSQKRNKQNSNRYLRRAITPKIIREEIKDGD